MGNTSIRQALYKAQRGRCHYCGVQMVMGRHKSSQRVSRNVCTIDHIVPKSIGGRNSWNNYVGACLACNNMRGSRPYKAFRWFIDTYGRDRPPEEVFRSIDREEFLKSKDMWLSLVRIEKPPEIILAPKWKTRRNILMDVRATIEPTVSSFDIFEVNSIWGKYLKLERGGGNLSSLDIQ